MNNAKSEILKVSHYFFIFKSFLVFILLTQLLVFSQKHTENTISKEASDWYLGAKARLFNEIDSLIENKGIIDEKSAFNLQLLDGNITGDGEAIEYANKVISYENSSPKALIEALYILRYWKSYIEASRNSIEMLKQVGESPVKNEDVIIFNNFKELIITSLHDLIDNNEPLVKLEAIQTLLTIDINKKNNNLKDVLLYYTKGTDESDWILDGIPSHFRGMSYASNYIKNKSINLLFEYYYPIALAVSEEILKGYTPSKTPKQFEDYRYIVFKMRNIYMKEKADMKK
ncbi:MAG: hypothetical protein PF638_10875 [Candidatus Delongbacteria bacterium]|jgi:hypothetical protein|nr:hypothetical protein [Candidatus Delongbacteria bacterium]